jgi:ATP-dependent phosphoenolpyruvate carboxykinase
MIKSFKDSKGVKTLVGNMVSYTGKYFGEEVTEAFIVKSATKDGSKIWVTISNDIHGEFATRPHSLINEEM